MPDACAEPQFYPKGMIQNGPGHPTHPHSHLTSLRAVRMALEDTLTL